MTTPTETVSPERVQGVLDRLTSAQEAVLQRVTDRRSVHSGRGGHSAVLMRALERKGLVKQGKAHVWETDWHFTALGTAVGRELHRRRVEALSQREAAGLFHQPVSSLQDVAKKIRKRASQSNYGGVSLRRDVLQGWAQEIEAALTQMTSRIKELESREGT